MTFFIAIALVLAVATLLLVFAPLFGRHRRSAAMLVVAGLTTTAALYALVGTPDALDPTRRATPQTLADATTRLEQELRRDPGQAEGWRLLAEAYKAQGRATDAARAYARVVELQPKDADLLAQAAEARALATPGRRFDADAIRLLERALEMDPSHQRAAWFLGVAQRQAGRPADAARTWEALLARVDASTATALREQIQSARADAGLPALADRTSDVAAASQVTVRVDIANELRSRLPPTTPVFVLARVAGGPPMPVAVKRVTLGELPLEVTLGDADSPMPTQRLSALRRVDVVARASASGRANVGPGDLESAPAPADVGGSVDVRIDRVRP